ncbi:MarR family winged helix-turn-helix transcriptional regulator [Bifidobacterium xylocopae]|uniref:MarR family transcriptional regulator n=1 Tax=Bifidobacterium xylocopae TaxID=2493119 RepID=A0A366KEW1_9BIFI|nr:MarR family transcriptional regulator [Bifidobacterium xylocopae]RBP99738.1 MarR family transcriptional regulator [Bifidobacterium xylocopae]
MGYADEAFEELSRLAVERRKVLPDQVDRSTRGEAGVLRSLEKFGDLTPSQLARMARLSSGRVSSLLRSLEEKGFISRQADEHDRRNVHVSITPAGSAHNRKARKMMKEDVCWVFEQMGEEQTREFIRLCCLFGRYVALRCEERMGTGSTVSP